MSGLVGPAILLGTSAIVLLALLTTLIVYRARRPERRSLGYALGRGIAGEPSDLGYEFESWTLERPDGATLPVWDVRHDEPAPPRTLVFVHGWAQGRVDMLLRLDIYRQIWHGIADRFVFVDLRGHGDADGGPSRLGAGESEDLLDLLERIDAESLVLFGHSMGARIAIQAAADPRGERVAGVIATGVYDSFGESLAHRLRRDRMPSRPLTDLAMFWFRLRGLHHRPLADSVTDIRCPVLFIHGRHDRIAPLTVAERLSEQTPNGTLHVIDDAAHGDMIRVAPDQVADAIREWTASL